MEHRVQTDVIFKLKVVDATGAPADAQLKVEASLQGAKDTIRVRFDDTFYCAPVSCDHLVEALFTPSPLPLLPHVSLTPIAYLYVFLVTF